MKSLHIGISTLLVVALSGCSAVGVGSKRIDYRAGAVQAPALEVPPDLTAPSNEDRYKVPGSEGESVATYSGYSGGAGNTSAKSRVLPQAVGVRLERNGGQQWLVVTDSPDAVWSVVKSFLGENGLSINTEDQAAGVMETEWAENRANIPEDGLRKLIGKALDSIYSSGERDQYRVRLARSADNATEVHITHKGMEEVISADGNTAKWQPRASDPELEAVMLQKLMARFGADAQAVAAVTAAANTPAANGGSAPAGDGKAALQDVFDGSRIIVINDAFDRSWRKAGLAIERAGLVVEDKDRTRGIYLLAAQKSERGWMDALMFWQDSEDTTRRFRVNVKDGGALCEVGVTDEDGTSDDTTNKMIDAIYKHIEQ
jgi:outer membrane protein assembly factor BamC